MIYYNNIASSFLPQNTFYKGKKVKYGVNYEFWPLLLVSSNAALQEKNGLKTTLLYHNSSISFIPQGWVKLVMCGDGECRGE